MRNIQFRKAKSNEIETVLTLLKEAAFWIREKKINHWQNWISPPPNFVGWIKQGFERDEFYIIEDDDLLSAASGCFGKISDMGTAETTLDISTLQYRGMAKACSSV
jgi:hypothetical protein